MTFSAEQRTWIRATLKAQPAIPYHATGESLRHTLTERYPNTYLAGINDAGVIVGGYGSNMTINSIFYPWEHGFLYSGGSFSTSDAPFGDVQVTQPRGMNNKSEIVGGYVDSQEMLYGFYAKATP